MKGRAWAVADVGEAVVTAGDAGSSVENAADAGEEGDILHQVSHLGPETAAYVCDRFTITALSSAFELQNGHQLGSTKLGSLPGACLHRESLILHLCHCRCNSAGGRKGRRDLQCKIGHTPVLEQ